MFRWKLSRHKLNTKSIFRKLGIDINGDCLFYSKTKENIDNVFKNNDLGKTVCVT